MLIWTNYVVVERGSVTDAECDKYCLCRNCQTDITHTHTYICITTYAFAQLHTHAYILTLTQVQSARAFNKHSHTTAVLVTACPQPTLRV